ncbi:MAG: diphosphate--fructose-6-phosphate 1-phosphotransferase [Terriglobia bacterium]
MRASALVAHGGGPTSVLNASLMGVIEAARAAGLKHLWAPRGGLAGVFRGDLADLLAAPERYVERLAAQSGSAIGSFRGKVEDFGAVIDFFCAREIRHFFYTGGNGSMSTAQKIAAEARARGYELATIGIPKTIDNDICETDHCPGFGSAARFAATAVREIGLDQRALPTPVSIVELMGRDTGWLAAAAILAQRAPDDAPHFIYVPEAPFDAEEFLGRIDDLLRRQGWVIGVVAEGLRDGEGKIIAETRGSSRDAKGRPLAGDVAAHLARLVSRKLRVRARSEKPGLLCRAFAPCQSPVDAAEARGAGQFAVRSAMEGQPGAMVALCRARSGRYSCTFTLVPLSRVADRERLLPAKYIRGPGEIRDSYRAYVAPLIGPALDAAVWF